MFTGLVEDLGRVVEVTPRAGVVRLGIATSLDLAEVRQGDSIAVDGACLTVTACRGDRFWVEAVPETLRCTTLGGTRPGHRVHLERALRLGDRLGGHLVQGHVDGTAAVRAGRRDGSERRLVVELPAALARYVARKGSIAVAGVSLTVAALDEAAFEVALIPTTLQKTWLGEARPGRHVNLEVDLMARYLERLAAGGQAADFAARERRSQREMA